MTMTATEAQKLADDWVAAWNAHDLEAILAHYADDVEFTSPFVARLTGDPSGLVRGKAALRDYFARGLAAYRALRFELREVLVGVGSVTLYYQSVNALSAAEVLYLDDAGRIKRAAAHYASAG